MGNGSKPVQGWGSDRCVLPTESMDERVHFIEIRSASRSGPGHPHMWSVGLKEVGLTMERGGREKGLGGCKEKLEGRYRGRRAVVLGIRERRG